MSSDSVIESQKQKYEAEFLLHQHDYFAESFWKNEESGETRLRFFIALVAAVSALVGALLSSDQGTETLTVTISMAALFALVTVGLALLLRMIRRDEVTDGYKFAMDMVRLHFLRFGTGNLSSFDPFGVDSIDDGSLSIAPGTPDQAPVVAADQQRFKRRFLTGGLVEAVIILNSLLIAALVVLASLVASPALKLGSQAAPWLLGLAALVLAGYLQYAYAKRKRQSSDAKLKIRRDQLKDRLFGDWDRQRL